MKTTIEINGEKVEITLTGEQVAEIQKATKKKFRWEYARGITYIVNMLE